VGGGGLSGIHIVRTVLRDLVLGRDAEPVEALWDAMYTATLPFGRKGVAIMALSGVDLALWDLRGRAERRSVVELLGGVRHSRVPVYGTAWGDIPDTMLGQYRAYKLHLGRQCPSPWMGEGSGGGDGPCKDNHSHPGPPPSRARESEGVGVLVEATARAREKLGSDCPLMVDAWMQWDVAGTLACAGAARALRLDWIEEPLPPDDLAGYAELVGRCPVPIAGGEHEFTAAAFAGLIDGRLHHVVQPDVCWCGGMTELVKIYRHAAAHGARVCPHRGGEVWALPALAALDPAPLGESGRPWLTWVGGQPVVRDGFLDIPDGPGFGVTIDEGRLPVVH
jgi:L-rhamnonate dehydratase